MIEYSKVKHEFEEELCERLKTMVWDSSLKAKYPNLSFDDVGFEMYMRFKISDLCGTEDKWKAHKKSNPEEKENITRLQLMFLKQKLNVAS